MQARAGWIVGLVSAILITSQAHSASLLVESSATMSFDARAAHPATLDLESSLATTFANFNTTLSVAVGVDHALPFMIAKEFDRGSGEGGGGNGVIGADGKSAFQLAQDNGFGGTLSQWLASIKGQTGDKGDPGEPGVDGLDGEPGVDGESAYQIALDGGFVGDQAAWLAALKGDKGDKGDPGAGGSGSPATVKEITDAAYTLLVEDADNVYVRHTNGNPSIITIPPDTFTAGQEIIIRQAGVGQIQIAAGAGVGIATPATLLANGVGATLHLTCVTPLLFDLTGDLSTTGASASGGGTVVGDTQTVTGVSTAALGGHRVVKGPLSNVQYADPVDAPGLVIGLTTGAASAGASVAIATAGEMVEPTWNWATGPVFLGANGVLTQTAPASGFVQQIGVATAPTKILIRIGLAIQLI